MTNDLPSASPSVGNSPRQTGTADNEPPEWPGPPCAEIPLNQRVEAVLLGADRPLSDARIIEILGLAPPAAKSKRRRLAAARTDVDDSGPTPETEEGEALEPADDARKSAQRTMQQSIHRAIEELNASYTATGRAFRVEAVAGGWQVLTLPAFGPLLTRLRGERLQTRLSQAALETLSIVAYRQPILRADLESIRGVACGEVLKSLLDRRLVRIVGRAEEVGRPMLYGTTKEFLRIFGIASLQDLPSSLGAAAAGR